MRVKHIEWESDFDADHFSLYRKYRVTLKRKSSVSYRVKSTPCKDAQLAEKETVATQHCSRAEQKVCYIRNWNAECAKPIFVHLHLREQ